MGGAVDLHRLQRVDAEAPAEIGDLPVDVGEERLGGRLVILLQDLSCRP
jgi:hypothetical protein